MKNWEMAVQVEHESTLLRAVVCPWHFSLFSRGYSRHCIRLPESPADCLRYTGGLWGGTACLSHWMLVSPVGSGAKLSGSAGLVSS